MAKNYDVKEEWEKTKKQLIKFGKEVGELVKKGEDEIITLSQKSKIQLEATTTNLKKEKLYYQIGKEYVQLSDASKPSAKLTQLLEVYHNLEQEQKTLGSKLKRQATKKSPKKTAKKTVRKTAPKTKVRKTVKKAAK